MLLVWTPLLSVILEVSRASPAPLYGGDARNRMSRDQECYEDEYWYRGKCCRTCPAGTSVSAHCTVNHARGVCESCTPGEYFTAAPSGMESCLPCLICKDDKVLVQECTPKTDAICKCKPGYYCRPDEPCEICNRCSRCGEGQHIKEPCTSTTDTVCEDVSAPEPTSTKANVNVSVPTNSFSDITGLKAVPTDPPDDPPGSKSYVFIVVSVLLTIFIIIPAVVYISCCRNRRAEGKSKDNIENSLIGATQNNSTNTSLDSVRISSEDKDPREEELPPERERLMTAEHREVEREMNQMEAPYVPGAECEPGENDVAESLGGDVECEESSEQGAECEECKKLKPCDQQWSWFYYAIINSVQPHYVVQLARRLCHHKASIEQIIKNNPNDCTEQNYQLLSHWRDEKGEQASMRAVLKELKEMDLGGCCENIENSLKSKKIPIN